MVVKTNRDLKAVCVLYQLKSLFVGGVIKEFGQQATHIAATFGYSTSKLRTYVAVLCKLGLITKPQRGTLVLASSRRIAAHYGLTARSFHQLPSSQLQDLETRLRVLAVAENYARQQHVLEQKVITDTLKGRGIPTPSALQPQHLRRLKKTVQTAAEAGRLKTRFTKQVASLTFNTKTAALTPFVTLSRQGLAKLLGRRSKATGHRYAKLFTKIGLLQDTPRRVFICHASPQEYSMMQEELLGYDYSFRLNRYGEVEKWLPNQLTVITSQLLYS